MVGARGMNSVSIHIHCIARVDLSNDTSSNGGIVVAVIRGVAMGIYTFVLSVHSEVGVETLDVRGEKGPEAEMQKLLFPEDLVLDSEQEKSQLFYKWKKFGEKSKWEHQLPQFELVLV